jgi:hypothetical protein
MEPLSHRDIRLSFNQNAGSGVKYFVPIRVTLPSTEDFST